MKKPIKMHMTIEVTIPFDCNSCWMDPTETAREVAMVLCEHMKKGLNWHPRHDAKPEWLHLCYFERIVSVVTEEVDE